MLSNIFIINLVIGWKRIPEEKHTTRLKCQKQNIKTEELKYCFKLTFLIYS